MSVSKIENNVFVRYLNKSYENACSIADRNIARQWSTYN